MKYKTIQDKDEDMTCIVNDNYPFISEKAYSMRNYLNIEALEKEYGLSADDVWGVLCRHSNIFNKKRGNYFVAPEDIMERITESHIELKTRFPQLKEMIIAVADSESKDSTNEKYFNVVLKHTWVY